MMSLCRNHAVLLLFLCTLPPFYSHIFTKAASTDPPVTRQPIKFVTLDSVYNYEDVFEDPSIPPVQASIRTPFLSKEPQPCQHNPCVEDQPPCNVLSQQTGCLCPGVSGASEAPQAPRIQELQPVREGPDSGKVEVQWCAPMSEVSEYRVIIEGNGQSLEFKDTSRRGLVGFLEAGTKVCVEAVNNAGHSTPSEFSCKRYEPPTSSDLMIGVLVGGVTLLLLLIIGAVIFWKCQLCQKTKRGSNDGLGNPSYSTGGTL